MSIDRSPCGPAAGFTLVEMLVALTLLGMVVAVLAGGLRLGLRVWEEGSRRSGSEAEVQAVYDFVRRLLEGAYPAPADDAVAFEGGADFVDLVAELPAHLAPGGLHRVRLFVGGSGERRQLALQRARFPPDARQEAEESEAGGGSVLLTGVQSVRFAYFGVDRPRAAPEWHDEWRHQARLPALISIDVRLGGNAESTWPVLVVAPLLGLPAVCAREPHRPICRRPAPSPASQGRE